MKKFSFRNVEISQKFWLAFGSNKKSKRLEILAGKVGEWKPVILSILL